MTKEKLTEIMYSFRDLWCQNIDLSTIDKFIDDLAKREVKLFAIPDVSVNEVSEFLRAGFTVCPHFDKCINNGKNEHCDLQTFQEIDCFIGQTER